MTTKFHALILKSEIKDNVYPGDIDVSGTVTCFGENFMVNSLLLFCFCFFCHETFSLHIIKLLWRVGKLCYLVMKIINSFLTEPKFYESHSSKCFRVISEDFLRLQTIPEDCRRFPKTNVEVRPLPKMSEEPSKHLTVFSSETANMKTLASLTENTKNYVQKNTKH